MGLIVEKEGHKIMEERVNRLKKGGNLGEQIRSRRLDMGMSLDNLAIKTGLPTLMVEKIEQGVNQPSEDTLALIAQALNMDIVEK